MPLTEDRFASAMDGLTPVVTPGFLSHGQIGVALIERDGTTTYANDAALRMLGVEADGVARQAWWRFWLEAQRPAQRVAITRAGLGEVVAADVDGITLTLTPARDRQGRVVRILAGLERAMDGTDPRF